MRTSPSGLPNLSTTPAPSLIQTVPRWPNPLPASMCVAGCTSARAAAAGATSTRTCWPYHGEKAGVPDAVVSVRVVVRCHTVILFITVCMHAITCTSRARPQLPHRKGQRRGGDREPALRATPLAARAPRLRTLRFQRALPRELVEPAVLWPAQASVRGLSTAAESARLSHSGPLSRSEPPI